LNPTIFGLRGLRPRSYLTRSRVNSGVSQRKEGNDMASLIGAYGLIALLASSPAVMCAQQMDYLARAQQLGLDSLAGRVPTYHSSGARERAAALQKMLEEAQGYFTQRIGVTPDVALAVLSEPDWGRLRALPYGVPWVSNSPHLAVLPADLERSVIVRGFAGVRERASPATRRALQDAGVPFDQVPYRLSDLIAYHEVGHVVVATYGLTQTQHWLDEMLATFAAYAFLRDRHPELARAWDALMAFNIEVYSPEFRSLEEFEKRYDGMPQDTYAWFQGMFHVRLVDLYKERGIGFFADLRGAGIVAGAKYQTTSELLTRLDQVAPGFQRWATLLGRGSGR